MAVKPTGHRLGRDWGEHRTRPEVAQSAADDPLATLLVHAISAEQPIRRFTVAAKFPASLSVLSGLLSLLDPPSVPFAANLTPDPMRLETYTGSRGLQELAPKWRDLTSKIAFKRHIHLVDWYLALAESFEAQNGEELHCTAAFDDNGLVAAFPYRHLTIPMGRFNVRVKQLLSDAEHSRSVRDMVLLPELAATNFLPQFVAAFAQHNKDWDMLSLLGILEDSITFAAIKHNAQTLKYAVTPGGAWGKIDFLTCNQSGSPFDRLSKGFRQNLRTAHNKMKSEAVTFEVGRTEAEVSSLLPELLSVESSGWKGEQGTSILRVPKMLAFVQRLVSHFAPKGHCELRIMRYGPKPIAALFGIIIDGVWYILRTGYDEAYHRTSPGHLIVENLLRDNQVNHRFHTLTPYNSPPWFKSWKPDRIVPIYNCWLIRPSPEGLQFARQIFGAAG